MMEQRARELMEDRTIVAAALLTLAGLGIRLRGITTDALWFDELYSLTLATSSITELLATTAADVHPPLYYLLLKGWTALFGTSELALRLPSAVLGAVTIALIFLAGRRLLDARTGLIAAALLAVSPLHTYWSQQARGYTLFTALVIVLTLFVLDLHDGDRSRLWPYLLVGTVLVYLHHFAWLFIGTHGLVVLWSWRDGRTDRAAVKVLGQAIASITVLWLPWSLTFLRQAGDVVGSYWVPAFRIAELERTVLMQLGQDPVAYLAVPLLVLGIIRLGRQSLRGDTPTHARTILAWLLGPPLVVLGFSLVVAPLFYHRFFLPVLPATLLAIGAAIRTDRAWLQYAVGGLLVVLTLVSLGTWTVNAELHQDWEAAATYLDQHAGPEDAVVFYDSRVQAGIEYYGDPVYRTMGFPDAFPLLDQEPYGRSELLGHRTVWVVINHDLDVEEGRDGDARLWRHDGYERVVEPLEQWYTAEPVLSDRLDNIEIYRLERR